jgi:hypothetical protein
MADKLKNNSSNITPSPVIEKPKSTSMLLEIKGGEVVDVNGEKIILKGVTSDEFRFEKKIYQNLDVLKNRILLLKEKGINLLILYLDRPKILDNRKTEIVELAKWCKENNLYINGNFSGRDITLGTQLQNENSKVLIDYTTKNIEYTSIKTKYIDYEYVLPIDPNTIYVKEMIYEIHGVYAYDDTEMANNYYSEGSYFYGGRTIYLKTPIENISRNVLVVYTAYIPIDQAPLNKF